MAPRACLLRTSAALPRSADKTMYPPFKQCVGAMDGTLIAATVPPTDTATFRSRKGAIAQNVMATSSANNSRCPRCPPNPKMSTNSKNVRQLHKCPSHQETPFFGRGGPLPRRFPICAPGSARRITIGSTIGSTIRCARRIMIGGAIRCARAGV